MRKTSGKYLGLLLIGVMLAWSCAPPITIGEKPTKPIVSMEQVRDLTPKDLANFAISLYNKRADWYKVQMQNVASMTQEQKKHLVNEYSLLTKSWPIIDLYDRTVEGGQQVDADLQIKLYGFIDKYLGGN